MGAGVAGTLDPGGRNARATWFGLCAVEAGGDGVDCVAIQDCDADSGSSGISAVLELDPATVDQASLGAATLGSPTVAR